jgi:TPR repeat protein
VEAKEEIQSKPSSTLRPRLAGHEVARFNLGLIEFESGNNERGVKHFRIAASAGHHNAMHALQTFYEKGIVGGRDAIDSTLTAYNNSCAEMRSKARDAYIHWYLDTLVKDEEKASKYAWATERVQTGRLYLRNVVFHFYAAA